jgi:hypothetical protein
MGLAYVDGIRSGEIIRLFVDFPPESRTDPVSCCVQAAFRWRFAGSYTTAGRNQLERFSWTGTSYSDETGTRPTEFSHVYGYQLVTQVE